MGIVNCTPDSFYPESRTPDETSAFAVAQEFVAQGADILDIGGESTRPGADPIEPVEQIRRIVPVIERVREHSTVPISVDTRSARVARSAIDAGADIVNDVSGLTDDPELAELVATEGVPVIVMHMRGTTKTMQRDPRYDDTIDEIRRELEIRIDAAMRAGVDATSIIIDPGIGFGKRVEDNIEIIRRIDEFCEMGFPILLGVSRKSFIESVLRKPVGDRLVGTLAAEAWAVIRGVDILRVHDVSETVDLVRMLHAIGDGLAHRTEQSESRT